MTFFVIFGMLASASPALASTARNIVGGRILASDTKARTLLIKPKTGKSVLVKVKSATAINRKGKPATFSKLRVGDKLDVSFDATTKVADDIEANPGIYTIHGSVESLDIVNNTLTVNSEEGGNSVTLKVGDSTAFWRHGVAATFSDIVLGDKVEAKYDSATMLASSVKVETEDGQLHGAISAISSNTVSITPELGGADVTLNVSLSTVIKRSDAVISLSQLLVGDKVEAKYDSVTMIASVIQSESNGGEVHGTVAAVDAVGSVITITPELGGADVTLNVNGDTNILRNDLPVSLGDLLAGDKVEAKYDVATMTARLIESEMEDGEVSGVIAAVDSAAQTVTITPELGGANIVVKIGTSTVISRNDLPAVLADLLAGDKVEAKYDSATMIASLVKAE